VEKPRHQAGGAEGQEGLASRRGLRRQEFTPRRVERPSGTGCGSRDHRHLRSPPTS
jgi:hypothetical protein